MTFDFSLEFQLSAPPKRVMELLTDEALVRRWSGEEAIIGKAPGEDFSMFDGWAAGEILKISENELAFTWAVVGWPEGVKPSEVHFHMTPKDGGTLLTLTHSCFPSEELANEHKSGWSDYFFDPLEDYIMVFDNR